MSRWVAVAASVALMGAMAVGMVGCGGDVRDDPWLAQKFKDIDSDLRKVGDLPTRVQDLVDDLDALEGVVLDMKKNMAAATGSPAAVKQLDARLAAIEKQLKTLESTVQSLSKREAAAPRPAPAKLSVKPPAEPGAAAPAPPAPTVTPAPPRGMYYTAVSGDTVKSVAAKFKTAVEAICKSNTYLQPDSALIPGQRYWIPLK